LLEARLAGYPPRDLKAEIRSWRDYNDELLRRLFTTSEVAEDLLVRTAGGMVIQPMTPPEALEYEKGIARSQVDFLRSLVKRLELHDVVGASMPTKSATSSRRVFLVHGHDEGAKQEVARFLESLDLEVIILHERPSRGRTVIEKFEANADVGFAVVLLTPDDVARARSGNEAEELRARQNVLLELGYFVGKLGRGNVCALKKNDVTVPSDLLGVVYVSFDESSSWRTELAKELRAADIPFDAARILDR
jgi:predicted nucleotide-binding protein